MSFSLVQIRRFVEAARLRKSQELAIALDGMRRAYAADGRDFAVYLETLTRP